MSSARRVLILYTGGTIGMVRGPRGYAPSPGALQRILASFPQLQDPNREPGWMTLSQTHRSLHYTIREYTPLLDSSNMGISDWNQIGQDIHEAYEDYDAFIVLHGTDTMAYTASALSYMLVNLGKTVILTGSQIPLVETRSDALDNLLGALTMAAEDIPEVCLYFHHKLMRGNRTRKKDAGGLDAFHSDNFPPLATLGIDGRVFWDRVRPPPDQERSFTPIQERHVACLRLYPGLTGASLRNFLKPPLKGLVLETYGAGNGPDNRPDLLLALREAQSRGVVMVNCTQCHRGKVKADYAAGTALAEVGVVSGSDMTVEAALTKLSWLLSQDLSQEVVRNQVQLDLRGELTGPSLSAASLRERDMLAHLLEMLPEQAGQPSVASLREALYPVLLCSAGSQGDLAALERMRGDGVDLGLGDYDGRTALHLAAAEGHIETVRYLLKHGAERDPEDRWGATPLQDAILHGHRAIQRLLEESGAKPAEEQGQRSICHWASRGDVEAVRRLLQSGVSVNTADQLGRTPLHHAAQGDSLALARFLLDQGADPELRDEQHLRALDYAHQMGHRELTDLLEASSPR